MRESAREAERMVHCRIGSLEREKSKWLKSIKQHCKESQAVLAKKSSLSRDNVLK